MGLISGSGAAAFKSVDRTNFTATAGQTTFTLTQGYSVGDVDVFLNGIKLVEGDDYFATNGSTVVLNSGAAVGDYLQVVSYNQFGVANTYTKTETDARYMVASGANPMTSYLRTPNYGVSSWSDSATASLEASVGSGEQGVGVKTFGRSVATYGGDVLYTADTRGAGGRHRFGYWNGTTFTSSMNIDAGGRVTKPLQHAWAAEFPGFTCTTASTVYYPSYSTPALNVGGGFNASTGKFTVTVSGVYVLFASYLRAGTAYVFRGRFYKNGSTFTAGEMRTTEAFTGYNDSCTHAQLIYANAGDWIGFGISCDTANGPIYNGGYNFFHGYLLG
jgi:hypothetical protein